MSTQRHDRPHRTVRVEVGQWSADIDVMIAPLMHEIWLAGIETEMSCESTFENKIWIAFPEQEGLLQFLNLVAVYEHGADTLYGRMHERESNDPDLHWEYEIFPNDAGLVFPDDGSDGPCGYDEPGFFFMFSVRFPPCDLPTVLARLQEHNRAAAMRSG